ncbi:MAG: Asp-tRNA(Asn)/Glu-tRNA(Gln) amidotransferase subunit GatC [Armatimonadota bacterium]
MTKPIDKDEIKKLAHLARLHIDDSEIEKYTSQINDIMQFFDVLKKAETADIKEEYSILSSVNRFREDKVSKSQSIKDTLKNAPDSENNFIKMPKILE